jgi:tight adherence protein B
VSSIYVFGSLSLAMAAVAILIKEALTGYSRRVDRRITQLRREGNSEFVEKSRLFRDLALVESQKHRLVLRLRQFVEQSAVPVTLPQLLTVSALLGLGLSLPLTLLRARTSLLIPPFLFGFCLPLLYVAWKRSRRIERFYKQLPEAFDTMGRAVQAGQSVPSALQIVATEGRQPLAKEFACACEQHNLGLSFEQTMQDLSRRIPVVELRILAIALVVQRQTGGNPLEIISNMSELIRKRASFMAKIRALTGEGRMQAIVLTLLPIVTFAGLWIARRDYIQCLLDRPRILQALVAAQIVAALWIKRIIRLDF